MGHKRETVVSQINHDATRYFFYGTATVFIVMALIIALLGLVVVAARAQDTPETITLPSTSLYAAYFVAADSEGVQQVWGLTLPDGQSEPLTHASQSVFFYAMSADHTQIAYVSDGQIWLQTVGENDSRALVAVSADPSLVTLALSPDGQFLAYADNALRLLNMSTGTTEELMTDVVLTEGEWDVSGLRHYSPLRFLDNERLMVSISMWETTTRGVYYLSQHMMQVIEGEYGMLEMMPLQDGRYLVFSETRVGLGVDGFLIGQPSASPQEPFVLTSYLAEFFAANQLVEVAITDTIEVAPGQLRFIGNSFVGGEKGFQVFVGTYDASTNAFTIDTSQETTDILAKAEWIHGLSGTGRYLAGYLDANYIWNGLEYTLTIVDLASGERVMLTAPSPMKFFKWADRK